MTVPTYAGVNILTERHDRVIVRLDNVAGEVMAMTDAEAGDWIKAVITVTLEMDLLPKGPGSL